MSLELVGFVRDSSMKMRLLFAVLLAVATFHGVLAQQTMPVIKCGYPPLADYFTGSPSVAATLAGSYPVEIQAPSFQWDLPVTAGCTPSSGKLVGQELSYDYDSYNSIGQLTAATRREGADQSPTTVLLTAFNADTGFIHRLAEVNALTGKVQEETLYDYDSMGRMTSSNYSEANVLTTTSTWSYYDPDHPWTGTDLLTENQVGKVSFDHIDDYHYTYDSQDRVVSFNLLEIDLRHNTTTRSTTKFVYDENNRLTSVNLGDELYAFTYDSAGRVASAVVLAIGHAEVALRYQWQGPANQISQISIGITDLNYSGTYVFAYS